MHSALSVWLLFVTTLSAQAPTPLAFDVASIRENKNMADGGGMRLMPDGGVRAQHVAARSLITIAYRLEGFLLIGGPDWMKTTYYDVEAKPATKRSREDTFTMLQTLLAERFKLVVHREQREFDGYALLRRNEGTLGPGLHRSTVDCEKDSTTPRCREGRITFTSMTVAGTPMSSVVQLITGQVGAPVSDGTALIGTYDVDLKWSNDVSPSDDAPSIFTAVQEQLGLKLERRRTTAEVLIVDHVERPAPD